MGSLLELSQRDISRGEFVQEALAALCDREGFVVGELRLVDRGAKVRWVYTRDNGQSRAEVQAIPTGGTGQEPKVDGLCWEDDGPLGPLFKRVILDGESDGATGCEPAVSRVTEGGAVSVDDTAGLFGGLKMVNPARADSMRSLAVLSLRMEAGGSGLLVMGSRETWRFGPEVLGYLEETAKVLGMALGHREARRNLRERVKEMSCLYALAQAAVDTSLTTDGFLRRCVELLPPGFRYPKQAAARIIFDGGTFQSSEFPEEGQRLEAAIRISGRERGRVEVAYQTELPERDIGPFLMEERELLCRVADNLGLIIEQRLAEQAVDGLQDQLRHADRLATIGQVTAGVVHELNEPLGSILGFAQLVKKEKGLAGQTRQDVDKIIAAALHAREVVKRLMLFARRMPPRRNRVNLNEVITEGLYFIESRCERLGIELVRDLQPDLPEIIGDASQLYQVLVNLVVNALQAMPEGGCITIRTDTDGEMIVMSIADTGVGMSEAVREKAMQPFFTTKSVNEGTGLGLAVVNGIISAHGGTIKIESEEEQGTRFEIRLRKGSEADGSGEVKTGG